MGKTEVPVTLTVAELWLLHDFCRHEVADDKWLFPPANFDLNEEIALALDACETDNLTEYTLLLNQKQLLVIDYWVRRDHKTPEGASGKRLLLKVFRARRELAMGMATAEDGDRSYAEEVKRHAGRDSGQNAD